MNRDQIVSKVILKLTSVNPKTLKTLIKVVRDSSGSDFIYEYIYRVLKESKARRGELETILERLVHKEKLHLISDSHLKAFKHILESFPYLKVKL